MGRVAKILPTSYSALSSFETCPRRHHLTRITKRVADPMGPEAQWGNRVHKALDDFAKDPSTPPPTGMDRYFKIAERIIERIPGAQIVAEQQLAVTADFEPCGWWDDNGWFRGIVDLTVLAGDTAYVFDWKTGKRKDDFDQLGQFSGLTFAHYPDVNTVKSAYIWLQPNEITSRVFTRKEVGETWAGLCQKVDRLVQAKKMDRWPARPSGLCRKWCPVGKAHCEHCGS